MQATKLDKNGKHVYSQLKKTEELNKEEVEYIKKTVYGEEKLWLYEDFKVTRNEKRELISVKGNELSEEAKEEIAAQEEEW